MALWYIIPKQNSNFRGVRMLGRESCVLNRIVQGGKKVPSGLYNNPVC